MTAAASTKPSTAGRGSARCRARAEPAGSARTGTAIQTRSPSRGGCAARCATARPRAALVRALDAPSIARARARCRDEVDAAGGAAHATHSCPARLAAPLPSNTALGALTSTCAVAREREAAIVQLEGEGLHASLLQISTGNVTLLSADSFGSGAMVGSSWMVADSSAFGRRRSAARVAFCADARATSTNAARQHDDSMQREQRSAPTASRHRVFFMTASSLRVARDAKADASGSALVAESRQARRNSRTTAPISSSRRARRAGRPGPGPSGSVAGAGSTNDR